MKCPYCDKGCKAPKVRNNHRVYSCQCGRKFQTNEIPLDSYHVHQMRVLKGAMQMVRKQMTDIARATLREKGYLK